MWGHSLGWAGHGDSKWWLGEQENIWIAEGGSPLASITSTSGSHCRDKLIGTSHLVVAH